MMIMIIYGVRVKDVQPCDFVMLVMLIFNNNINDNIGLELKIHNHKKKQHNIISVPWFNYIDINCSTFYD